MQGGGKMAHGLRTVCCSPRGCEFSLPSLFPLPQPPTPPLSHTPHAPTHSPSFLKPEFFRWGQIRTLVRQGPGDVAIQALEAFTSTVVRRFPVLAHRTTKDSLHTIKPERSRYTLLCSLQPECTLCVASLTLSPMEV